MIFGSQSWDVRTFRYSVLAMTGSNLPYIEAASIVPLSVGTGDGAIKLINANDIGAAKIDFSRITIERSVAENIARQLEPLIAQEKWPPNNSPANTMRGIDFYTKEDFVFATKWAAAIFKARLGYVPNLASPMTFNERIFARKFFAPLPMPSLADKLAAYDYVKARLGDEYIPRIVWVGDDPNEFLAAKLPTGKFVLKANNGWGRNLFLSLPGDLLVKRDEIANQATGWLQFPFGYGWGEWQYCTYKPRLFLEEFIDFGDGRVPDDYKFFCFRGKAHLIEIDVDRHTQTRTGFYHPSWQHIPVAYTKEPIQRERPHNLDEMLRIAEAIAHGMEFARIDLYSDRKSKIIFGEITFTPSNAGARFSDPKFDLWLGSHFGQDADIRSSYFCPCDKLGQAAARIDRA